MWLEIPVVFLQCSCHQTIKFFIQQFVLLKFSFLVIGNVEIDIFLKTVYLLVCHW